MRCTRSFLLLRSRSVSPAPSQSNLGPAACDIALLDGNSVHSDPILFLHFRLSVCRTVRSVSEESFPDAKVEMSTLHAECPHDSVRTN